MSTHNICFYRELMKIILHLSSNTPLICSTVIFYCISLSYNFSYDVDSPTSRLSAHVSNALSQTTALVSFFLSILLLLMSDRDGRCGCGT